MDEFCNNKKCRLHDTRYGLNCRDIAFYEGCKVYEPLITQKELADVRCNDGSSWRLIMDKTTIEIECNNGEVVIQVYKEAVELGKQTYPIETKQSELIANLLMDRCEDLCHMTKEQLMGMTLEAIKTR